MTLGQNILFIRIACFGIYGLVCAIAISLLWDDKRVAKLLFFIAVTAVLVAELATH